MSTERRPIRVALFCDYYLPGFRAGGPPVSISRIIEQETQADIKVVTRDRDAGQTQPYSNAAIREWAPYGRAQVAYLRPGYQDWPWVIRELREWQPDILYLNSLQSPWFSLLPHILLRLGLLPESRVLLAPRGETSSGAQSLKVIKKSIARPAIRRLLGHPLTWHPSSYLELIDIGSWWGNQLPTGHMAVVASDPPPPPAPGPSTPAQHQILRILFASRIERMKGLLELIHALMGVKVPIQFHVHGVVRDHDYWRECLAQAEKLPTNIAFRYFGEYRPSQAATICSNADLFALLTYGENFGHAVGEALAVGCPVLLTPTTSWTPIIEDGAGVIFDADLDLQEILTQYCLESREDRMARRRAAWSLYCHWYSKNGQPSSSLFDEQGWIPVYHDPAEIQSHRANRAKKTLLGKSNA